MFHARNIPFEFAERTQAICYGGIGLMPAHAPRICSEHFSDDSAPKSNFSDQVIQTSPAHAPRVCSEHFSDDSAPKSNFSDQVIQTSPALARECGLIEAIDAARQTVRARQPDEFFEQAAIDMDGHIVETGGACKQGIDICYDGRWGRHGRFVWKIPSAKRGPRTFGPVVSKAASPHPLLISPAETGEPLRIVNRSGNRPSHEGAAAHCDDVIALLRTAGFRNILLRGDTDYSQSEHLDRWDEEGIVFHFGCDARPNLLEIADDLEESQWKRLKRPPRCGVKTKPRARPQRVKETIVVEREFENVVLKSEDVAEFDDRPAACKKTYRMIVVRKKLSVEKGENVLFDDVRYFFYVANDRAASAAEVVFSCNARCDQENLIEQLANGPRAFRAPLDNLDSNWAEQPVE